ncbi:MAG: glycosyl hydrolase family 9 [Ruminiclostridium sp.]|nr:glycosyl hydrolase family 9 [Ruminiclostridium sp.]
MKKFWALLLILCLVFTTMTACNKNKKNKQQPTAGQPTTAATAAPTKAPEPTKEAKPTEPPMVSEEEERGNLMPGGYFNQLSPKWGTYTESGGDGKIALNTKGQLEVTINSTGSVKHAIQVYCDGFKVLQNAVYKVAFDISSTAARTMEWRVQLNGGDYHAYATEENIAITAETMHYENTFTMTEASDPAPRFCLNLGFHEADGKLPAHTVTVDNVELILLDASKAEVSNTEDEVPSININQVGYRTDDKKTAIFRDSSLDTTFEVVDVKTGKAVFSGKVSGSVNTPSAGETVAYGDFTEVTAPGTYKIVAANSGESYEFVIADKPYDKAFADALKMLYLMRCGSELEDKFAGDFAHEACHTQPATIYGTNKTKDVSGGWHDAGDYGRYVVPGVKAAADLLLAYEDYSSVFNDKLGIPESGNGIPDVLDEAKYELEWLFKMQDEASGGVYHKVTGLNFDGMIMPEEVKADLYILPVSNAATGAFASVMAMAARIYEPFDAAFAKECLAAAKTALSYLESNANKSGFKNPKDVSTGEYGDENSPDEVFWALSELYKTTGDSSYHEKLKALDMTSLDNGLGWQAVSLYGCYAYLTSEKTDATLKNKIQDKFNTYLASVEKNIKADGYFSAMGDVYPWGSNMTLANNGMVLLMAGRFSENKDDLAKKQMDYLLGANSTSYCFVTGYGTLTPNGTHHRPSIALGTTMKGMLVGGANSNLEDPYAQNVLEGKPPAKCYVDNLQSYSCNEITIYWNSPLVYLMAGLLSE